MYNVDVGNPYGHGVRKRGETTDVFEGEGRALDTTYYNELVFITSRPEESPNRPFKSNKLPFTSMMYGSNISYASSILYRHRRSF